MKQAMKKKKICKKMRGTEKRDKMKIHAKEKEFRGKESKETKFNAKEEGKRKRGSWRATSTNDEKKHIIKKRGRKKWGGRRGRELRRGA